MDKGKKFLGQPILSQIISCIPRDIIRDAAKFGKINPFHSVLGNRFNALHFRLMNQNILAGKEGSNRPNFADCTHYFILNFENENDKFLYKAYTLETEYGIPDI